MLNRLRKSLDEKDQGFTLIELLVVVVIIGVLAAIAIPVFLSQRDKAAEASVKSDLRNLAASMETAYVDNQTYPVVGAIPTDFKKSGTNDIKIKSSGAGVYCLTGATSTTAPVIWWYSSNGGGLTKTLC